jgi:SAM-dependent methyltransferase
MRELLIGAGNARLKKLWREGASPEFHDVVTLDIDPRCQPDVLWDLNVRPLPFADEEFDQIHAYEVLEHVGRQGDWQGFFAEFSEYWRILAPAGVLILSCPKWDSKWAWGDPGHTRVIGAQCFTFLDQDNFTAQVGVTAMTDYRAVWKHCFKLVHQSEISPDMALYALQKV